jgi:hypothetical protein
VVVVLLQLLEQMPSVIVALDSHLDNAIRRYVDVESGHVLGFLLLVAVPFNCMNSDQFRLFYCLVQFINAERG